MKLKITRFKNIVDGTIGKFEVKDKDNVLFTGYTLEPAGDDTVARGLDQRIPEGIYRIEWYSSPRFKRVLPLLYNEYVPKDRYILIHAGNFPKDTEGCILVGLRYNETGVFESVKALNQLLTYLKPYKPIVEIINDGV